MYDSANYDSISEDEDYKLLEESALPKNAVVNSTQNTPRRIIAINPSIDTEKEDNDSVVKKDKRYIRHNDVSSTTSISRSDHIEVITCLKSMKEYMVDIHKRLKHIEDNQAETSSCSRNDTTANESTKKLQGGELKMISDLVIHKIFPAQLKYWTIKRNERIQICNVMFQSLGIENLEEQRQYKDDVISKTAGFLNQVRNNAICSMRKKVEGKFFGLIKVSQY